MTTRIRYVLLGGVVVLIVGLAGGLIAHYGVRVTGALAVEPGELVYVPADAAVVAFANVRQIMESDVRQQVRQLFPDRPGSAGVEGRRTLEQRTGVNLETDIEHIVAYMVPAERTDQSDAVALARGRFDQARLEQFAAQHGAAVETYQGKRLLVLRSGSVVSPQSRPDPLPPPDAQPPSFRLPPGANGNPEMAVAFLQPRLVVFGTNSAVRRVIDLESGRGTNITANDQFMRLIAETDGGHAWAVGSFERMADHVRLPQNLASNLPAITYFSVMGQIDSGVSGWLKVEARDAQAARSLSDVVSGFLALAKLQTGASAELQTVLQSLRVESVGDTVTLSFALPAAALPRLMQREPGRNGP